MRSIQSTLFTLLIASSTAYADTTINLTPGVSPISHDIYQLHMTVFWICVVIGLIVFSAMFYSMFYHRKSRGAKPAEFHSHPWLEIGWSIIPVIILVLMAIPATKVLLNMNNDAKEDLTVKITGYQWKWHYEYLEDNVSFFSNLSTPMDQIQNKAPKTKDYLREVDHPLVLPIHKKIRLLITSNDVNHAWWVPELGVKRDAISGFINEAWTIINKPGVYHGQCAELCGVNHAFMPIVVIATTEQGYRDFIAQQKGQATKGEAETNREWSKQELMTHGEQIYSHICAACHQAGGVGLPPTFPALKGSKVATGPIEKHIDTVMNGVSGTAMQAFKNQMSEVDLASVITFERNAWGNNTNTLVQPIQIKALKDGKSMAEALATKPGASTAAPVKEAPKDKVSEATTTVPATSSASPVAATPAAAATSAPAAPAAATLTTATPNASTSAAETPNAESQAKQLPVTPEIKEAMVRGEKVYLSICAACHQPTGLGLPPTFPALKGSKVATGPIANHIDTLMNGKKGTAMVAFKDMLNDQQMADVITYERNAWDNNTGDLVTPEMIVKAREQQSIQSAPDKAKQ